MITLTAAGRVLQVNARGLFDWTLNTHLRMRRTQTGSLRTWKNTPCHLTHHLKIDSLTIEKYNEIVAFFKAVTGYAICYFDSENQQHNNCFLLNEPLVLERIGYVSTGQMSFDLQEPL